MGQDDPSVEPTHCPVSVHPDRTQRLGPVGRLLPGQPATCERL